MKSIKRYLEQIQKDVDESLFAIDSISSGKPLQTVYPNESPDDAKERDEKRKKIEEV